MLNLNSLKTKNPIHYDFTKQPLPPPNRQVHGNWQNSKDVSMILTEHVQLGMKRKQSQNVRRTVRERIPGELECTCIITQQKQLDSEIAKCCLAGRQLKRQ